VIGSNIGVLGSMVDMLRRKSFEREGEKERERALGTLATGVTPAGTIFTD